MIARQVMEELAPGIISEKAPRYRGSTTNPDLNNTGMIDGYRMNKGDWIAYVGETQGNWEHGYCYEWGGTLWGKLSVTPENMGKYTIAVSDLVRGAPNGYFTVLFCETLVANQALISKLFTQSLVMKQIDGQGGSMKSENYDPVQKVGWLIDYLGNAFFNNAEFNNGIFRGRVEANSGTFHGRIEADEGYFRGNVELNMAFFGNSLPVIGGIRSWARISHWQNYDGGYDISHSSGIQSITRLSTGRYRIYAENSIHNFGYGEFVLYNGYATLISTGGNARALNPVQVEFGIDIEASPSRYVDISVYYNGNLVDPFILCIYKMA